MITKSLKLLQQLHYGNGLFAASRKDIKTGYNLSWIRDNIYTTLGFEAVKNYGQVKKTYRALLDMLLKYEYKIDWAIKEKPTFTYQYIHARYDPITMQEIYEPWGNKQNDAIGALLFKIGDLEQKGVKIIRNHHDKRILQKLVYYLQSIEYWHDTDNGMWEENEELHASSVGSCVAGLKKISKIVDVPKKLIQNGEKTLKKLLPKESKTKEVDLALLSLIYPYNTVDKKVATAIIKNIEKNLVKDKGVIRYKNDPYYNNGSEAEWTMGFPWLAIIHKQLNQPNKYAYYIRKTLNAMNNKGELPELYFGGSNNHNENTPLAWSQSLAIVMHVQNV